MDALVAFQLRLCRAAQRTRADPYTTRFHQREHCKSKILHREKKYTFQILAKMRICLQNRTGLTNKRQALSL